MTLERRSPGEGSPWEIVIDKPLARAYMQCKHCAGYSFIKDMLARKWAMSSFGVFGRVSRMVGSAHDMKAALEFMLRHVVCGTIWREGHHR